MKSEPNRKNHTEAELDEQKNSLQNQLLDKITERKFAELTSSAPEFDPQNPQFNPEKYKAAADQQISETVEELSKAQKALNDIINSAVAKAAEQLSEPFEKATWNMLQKATEQLEKAAWEPFVTLSNSLMSLLGETNGKAMVKSITMAFHGFIVLQPFLQEELRKPEYKGQKIEELSPELQTQAFNNARNALADFRKNELPKVSIKRADIVEYPVDKINSTIWKLLEEDTQKQIALRAENKTDKKKGKQIDIFFAIDFDEMSEDIEAIKRLQPFDKRVYIAVSALYNAGNSDVSETQIYYAMGYTGKPGAADLERIHNSITKMSSARIRVDNTQESATYKYQKFVYDSSLLPMERITAIVNGKKSDAIIRLFREPPLITFAKGRSQISTVPIKVLQSPVSKTNPNLNLEDYLLERILRDKKQKSKGRILYKTIYDNIGLKKETPANQRQIKKRLPGKIKKYLDHYIKTNLITNYSLQPDGITVNYH